MACDVKQKGWRKTSAVFSKSTVFKYMGKQPLKAPKNSWQVEEKSGVS